MPFLQAVRQPAQEFESIMVSSIDAFANLAAVTVSPPSTVQPRSSATDAVDDRVPDANAPPRDGDPAPAAEPSDTPAVNRFNEAVEPPAGSREATADTEFVATPDPADANPISETPPPASGLAAVSAEARGANVDLAV
jgi:hypothetical protein